jgi:tetratricopeptide (TPR) repeat protein
MRWKIQLAQQAIAAHDDAAYRRYLALLNEMTGNVALAESHYRASLEILPEHPIMLRALATFLMRRNRHEEAEPIARRILAMTPESNENFNLYAGTLAALGRSLTLEQAIATVGKRTPVYSVKASKRVILTIAITIANRFGRQSLPAHVIRRIIERPFSIRKDFLSTDEWLDRKLRRLPEAYHFE